MREIRGWQIGEVVTANYMTLDTANVLEEIGSNGEANLPCIYNGLTLQSQSGSGNSIVTFNPGVCRCQNLPVSTYTYLPTNAYGTSYPCFIDISTLDTNTVITLTTSPSPGYIVATFSINPVTSGSVDYVITGSLLQIATGSYNPQIHVRLCSYTYTGSTFVLNFTPKTSRDTDLTGVGGVQWNYQNNSLELNIPASQSGSSIVAKQNFTAASNLIIQGTGVIQSGDALQFYNPANTHFTSLKGGISTSNTSLILPLTDGSSGQALTTDGSGNLSFTSVTTIGNIAANDSNVIFTSSSATYQICNPTAARTYTMPSILIAGVPWVFYNHATSSMNYITLQTSGSNPICIVPPLGYVVIVPTSATPTTASNWFLQERESQWVLILPTLTFTGIGTPAASSTTAKMSGDTLITRLGVTTGITTASLLSCTIPYGLIIDINKVHLSNTTAGPCQKVGDWEQNVVNNFGFSLVATVTSTSLIYFGGTVVSNVLLNPQNGNAYVSNSAGLTTNFEIPVTL